MRRPRLTTMIGIAAVLALLLAACGASPAASPTDEPTEAPPTATDDPGGEPTAEPTDDPGGGAETVRLDGFAFSPAEITIAAGTEVTFVNADPAAHTVTEGTNGQAVDGAIVDDELAANASTKVTFDEPGTYDITCRFHPSMQLTVIVEG